MIGPTSNIPTPLGNDVRLMTFEGSKLSYVFKDGKCFGYMEHLPMPDMRIVARRLEPSVFDKICETATEAIEHIMGG